MHQKKNKMDKENNQLISTNKSRLKHDGESHDKKIKKINPSKNPPKFIKSVLFS